MSNKNKILPKLRFHDFDNDGEWSEKQIEDHFTVGSSKRVLQQDWTTKGVPFFRTRELVSLSKREPFKSEVFISEELYNELLESYGAPKKGDFLVSGVGTLGICYQVQESDRFYFKDGNVLWFKLKPGVFSTYFKFCFESDHIQKQIVGQTSLSTVGTYTIQNANKTLFWFPPSYKEQQKIATCLSSLDNLISAESEKLELLKEHKKGLLQNLFPRIGENVPKLRFKEFKSKGEWICEQFAKHVKLYRGSSPRPIQNYFTTDSKGVNWIKIGDTKNADNFVIYRVEERITPEGAEKSRKVNVGELILANSMSFGKTYRLAIEGYIYDGWFVLREYEDYYDKQFLMQLLNSEYMQSQYKKLSAGGIVQNISSDIVYKTILPHTSKREQEKIASCLSALDIFISAQSKKVEALKLHKNGLLQGLFPEINEEN